MPFSFLLQTSWFGLVWFGLVGLSFKHESRAPTKGSKDLNIKPQILNSFAKISRVVQTKGPVQVGIKWRELEGDIDDLRSRVTGRHTLMLAYSTGRQGGGPLRCILATLVVGFPRQHIESLYLSGRTVPIFPPTAFADDHRKAVNRCSQVVGSWSKEEDAKLLKLVNAYGQGQKVSTRAPRRRRGSSVAARCLSLLLCFVLSPTVEGGGLGGGPGACQGLRVWGKKKP